MPGQEQVIWELVISLARVVPAFKSVEAVVLSPIDPAAVIRSGDGLHLLVGILKCRYVRVIGIRSNHDPICHFALPLVGVQTCR